jgi:hypothetical protein
MTFNMFGPTIFNSYDQSRARLLLRAIYAAAHKGEWNCYIRASTTRFVAAGSRRLNHERK